MVKRVRVANNIDRGPKYRRFSCNESGNSDVGCAWEGWCVECVWGSVCVGVRGNVIIGCLYRSVNTRLH